jgi:hypothetical protein
MEVPSELKPDLHRLLLGPLSLAVDLYGALIPGCLLISIVFVKKRWVSPVLTYALLGYKTKVVLMLFASFVAGKVLLSGFAVFAATTSWLAGRGAARIKARIEARSPAPKQELPNTKLGVLVTQLLNLLEAHQIIRAFVGALLTGSVPTKFQIADQYVAHKAVVNFHLGAGSALIVSSFIPGDGNFRVLEFVAGLLLLIAGLRAARERRDFFPAAVGIALNESLSNLTPEQFSVVANRATEIITKLYRTPAKQAAEGENPGSSEGVA